jgi:hypothetical protein
MDLQFGEKILTKQNLGKSNMIRLTPKFTLFIIATVLSFILFDVNLRYSDYFLKNSILIFQYVVLILIGLYDIGAAEEERERREKEKENE